MHKKLFSTLSEYDTIILVGGGTGGHIQPILSITEELKNKKFLWVGGKDSNEEKEARKVDICFESISTLKLSTTRSPRILLYPVVLILGIIEARKILAKHQKSDTCLFSKGGPGSVAVGIAAWTLGIPLYIHESDTIPGRSNRLLGKFAETVFLGFESARKYFKEEKSQVIGQILHRVFYSEIKNIKGSVNWKTTRKHILVICGSQGAKSIFEAMIDQLAGCDEYECIISLGKLNSNMKKNFERMKNTQTLEWISQIDIAHLLEDSDIVITRGSATTLAEIDVFAVKKIIIPLPHSAGNHQYWNAKEYEKRGDTILEQKNLFLLSNTLDRVSAL